MDDMNQALAKLTPEQRQLVELMLRQSEEQVPTSENTISQQRIVGAVPLSFAQQRLWFLDQLAPGSPVYNLPLAMRVDGKLDVNVLTKSLNEVVVRHEVLRTTFATEEGQPTQVIAPSLSIPLPLIELPAMSQAEQVVRVQQLALEEASQPFNLECDPLMRASLLRLSASEHVLLLTMHHSVSDGWSISVLMREMAVLYHAFSAGQPSPLPNLPIQYKDYAIWQRRWLTGEVLEQQLGYWKRQLSGDLPTLDLSTDHPRPLVQSFHGAITKFQISSNLTDRLKALSQQHSVTLFMVLLAAFQTLLHRYTGQRDIITGTPIANRNRVETEGLIGFFVNTLALRVDLSGNPTFGELLQRVRKVALEAYAHQDLPFERLVDELQLKRDTGRTPLFQVMLVLQNMPIPTIEAAGLKLTWLEMANSGTAKFDLTMTLTETADGLRGALEYSADLFEAATMGRLLMHYQTLLAGVVANPGQHLSELPLLTGAEQHQLLVEWNASKTEYSQGECIHELFEAQVEKTPEAVAVVFQGQELTYAGLNARANQLAYYLRSLGVGPDVLVGICLERSLEMIVSVLGILKAGGAYVPFDPTYPSERLTFMLNDAKPAVLLTQDRLQSVLPANSIATFCLDSQWELLRVYPSTNLKNVTLPSNLAYVIYTSGSTGRPKGVSLPVSALCNLLVWQINASKRDAGGAINVLQFASLNFDVSFQEIFSTLCAGDRLILIDDELHHDMEKLSQFIFDTKLQRIFLPNAVLQHFAAYHTPALKTIQACEIITAGEKLVVNDQLIAYAMALGGQYLYNQYGPSEAHVVTQFELACAEAGQWPKAPPIGRPINHIQIYILDAHGNPVPVGVPGELHIAGDGLARGYLYRPDLTAEKFIPNPFSAGAGSRMYKSGDLARYLPDGNIEFLGRIDHQVKVRGFRVELGEIETALAEHVDIQSNVVLIREDTPGDKRLVAYLVSQQKLDPAELRSFLKHSLPDYMLPSAFIFLEQLPLTPNGKVDRKALPAPSGERPELNQEYVAPRTPVEEILSKIWADLLHIERVGIQDNFFSIGGDSLLSIRLLARMKEQAGLHLTPMQFMQHPTIAEQVELAGMNSPAPAVEQDAVIGQVPLTPPQDWFFRAITVQPERWSTNICVEVYQPLNVEPLRETLRHLLMHHDALRARFVFNGDEWQQSIASPEEINPFLTVRDLSAFPPERQQELIVETAHVLQNSHSLGIAPLLRVAYLNLGALAPARLLISCHHLVMDGFSMGIIIEDFQRIYAQLALGQVVSLPLKTSSFKVYAEQLTQRARAVAQREIDYWLNRPWEQVKPLPMDTPLGRVDDTYGRVENVPFQLGIDETDALFRAVKATDGAQLKDFLLTALMLAFKQWKDLDVLFVKFEHLGRNAVLDELDLSRTVGWMATVSNIFLEVGESMNPVKALAGIMQQTRGLPMDGLGLGLLEYLAGDPEYAALAQPVLSLPQPHVFFNYLGRSAVPQQSVFGPPLEILSEWNDQRNNPLEVFGNLGDTGLTFKFRYGPTVYRRETIETLAALYQENLLVLGKDSQK